MSTPSKAKPLEELQAQVAECAWALSLSEEHLRAVLSAAPDAIITIDHQGTILMANRAVSRIFGYQPEELVGQNVKVLMPPSDRQHHDEYLERYQRTRQAHIIGIGREVIAQRKDGTQFPAELTVTEVDHLNLYVGFVRDISQRRRLEREVLEVAGREQRRISQDLHDSVGQELTALALLSAELEQALRQARSPQAELAAKIAQGVRHTLEEVRAISRGLNPVPIDKAGLMSALEDLVQRLSQQTQAQCVFRCPRPVNLADNFAATQLFQVAQEATTNALKHARPKRLEICLERDDQGRVVLRVTDDGVGLPTTASVWLHGMGLRTMRNRAQLLGAELTIERGPQGGTQITCLVPQGRHVQDHH
jgi:PAS domain S-box-containing protein